MSINPRDLINASIADNDLSRKHGAALLALVGYYPTIVHFSNGNRYVMGRNTAYSYCKGLGLAYNESAHKWEKITPAA